MANPEHVKILKQGVKAWNKWRVENPDIIPDLSEAKLSGASLSGADLRAAHLSGADLSGADLRKAVLWAADLSEANLSGAGLSGAHLSGAVLSGVNLSEANLRGVDLVGAKMSGAHLSGAKLTKANLSEADLSEAVMRGANLSGADFSEANLSGAGMRGANLSGANLSKVDLTAASLRETNLIEANLSRAELTKAWLIKADLSEANLRRANLVGAHLVQANLSGADLRKANLTEVEFADPEGHSASLDYANLAGARLTRRGEGRPARGFLELAAVEGLETADFGDPGFLPDYLTEAFEYAHQPELPEKKEWPDFVDKAISRIKLLRTLYPEAQPPPALVEAVTAIRAELITYLAEHPDALYNIRPRQFEELIAEILASYGWEVQLTPATRDGGYDIFAISKDDKAHVQTSWIIECKKYAPEKKVGVDIVRGLYGLKCELRGVGNAMLATTSDFSRDARKYKASRYDLTLKNYQGILEWINTYHPNPDGKLYIKDNKLIVPGQD